MNLIKLLHETAMEFVDFATRAKNRGDLPAYNTLIEKAFMLEKEAALKMYYDPKKKTSTWKYILLRSAGWLAFQSGKKEEAAYLVQLGLNTEPPSNIKEQFNELWKELKYSLPNKEDSQKTDIASEAIQIEGILTQANAAQKEIYLESTDNQTTYLVRVPDHLINDIVKSYWSALVTVEGVTNPLGGITLEKIQLAA